MRRFLAVAVAAALLVSCGDSAAPDDDGEAPPDPSVATVDANGFWALRSGRAPSGPIEVPPDARITMEIDGDEVRGSIAGCNSYGGGLAIDGDTFEAGELALTEIGCPADVTEAQERFVEALGDADGVSRKRKTLTLRGPETQLVFELVPPIDPKPLTETPWILETLVQGERASSTVASAEPARLLLRVDGTFEGTTGCRSFSGTWEVVGDVVTVNQMVFEGMCKTAADQDAHVAAVLGTGFRAERKEDRLTLTSQKDDLGLVYRSR